MAKLTYGYLLYCTNQTFADFFDLFEIEKQLYLINNIFHHNKGYASFEPT